MKLNTRIRAIAIGLASLAVAAGPPPRRPAPAGVWIGQDGQDRVGRSVDPGPSDIQDIHIRLRNLPTALAIRQATIRGRGSDEWQYGGGRSWLAEIVRIEGSPTADVFLEPSQVETGRPFEIHLQYDDGSAADFEVAGGRADPDRRMPAAALTVRWVGQDGSDFVGSGAAVGPDGAQDVRVELGRLSTGREVVVAAISVDDGRRWESGPNPRGWPNAELVRRTDDRTKADLYFQSETDLDRRTLRLEVRYGDGTRDAATLMAGPVALQPVDPGPPLADIPAIRLDARWLGQDATDPARPGDVRVEIANLPAEDPIEAAALSDSIQGQWTKPSADASFAADPTAWPVVVTQTAGNGRATLRFEPYRDEAVATFTLRLRFRSGSTVIGQFAGGRCDPALRVAGPGPTAVDAGPGADLADLIGRHGTVRFGPGTYRLDRPLVLDRPVHLLGASGSTLIFRQRPSDPPWTAAIAIHEGRTTLEGFAVRFEGPIRWDEATSYGPAVIGTTAGRDPGRHGLKADIRLLNLDLEAPAPADSRGHAPAVRLARLVSATSGRVAGNRLKGGMIEFEGGPWTIEENDYRGAVGGTVVDSIFAGHDTHDLILRKNRAKPEAGSGKTWRFLVLTRRGSGDAIEGNEVEGLGPRPGDGVPDMNAPEAILTESYQIRFEGRAAAISPDRTLVRLPTGRTDSPQVGDAVAILSGEGAGTWRRVAQVVGPNCIRLDDPLPVGARGISVAAGFFGMRIEANRLDGRGGTGDNLVLAGNHFGTAIVANRFLGGRHAFRLLATPTERPMPWGWSHAPFLGGRLERNVVVDADCGGKIAVEHSEAIKSNRGRVYLTMTARDNIFAHPSAPVDRRPGDRDSAGLNVGDLGSLDPGELVLDERNNRGDPGSADPGVVTFRVTAGVINGEPTSNRPRPWSAPPSP